MESLAEALKIFLEKHLIPTVISLFGAGIVLLFIPNDSWMIKKITVTGVYLLIAAGCFLVVQLLRYSYEALSEKRYWKKRGKESKIQDEKREMECLWSFMDAVNPEDLKIIKKLMKSENKPIEYEGYWFSPDSILENDTVMVSRQISRNGKMIKQYMLRHKTFEVSELNDELTFKSELLSAYNLYADLVEHYMNMVMHGFAASRKESVEVSKADEMRTAVTIRNNAMALKKAGYQCEANPNHSTFINPNTGKNFMQAMHLIPISAQNKFNVSLDIPANVCCLCPNCAALLHHGSDSDRQEMLMQLYMKHKPDLEEAGISITLMELFKVNGME